VIGTFPSTTEWTIVGGTGTFSMARGTIKYTVDASRVIPNDRETVFKLDVHAYYYSTVSTAVSSVPSSRHDIYSFDYFLFILRLLHYIFLNTSSYISTFNGPLVY
jgi:hypothetical protein